MMLAPAFSNHTEAIPILQTTASKKEGVAALLHAIEEILSRQKDTERKQWLLTEKAYQLIRDKRMKDVSKIALKNEIAAQQPAFNLYRFIKKF
jgi:LAO/AO transport system kinase